MESVDTYWSDRAALEWQVEMERDRGNLGRAPEPL